MLVPGRGDQGGDEGCGTWLPDWFVNTGVSILIENFAMQPLAQDIVIIMIGMYWRVLWKFNVFVHSTIEQNSTHCTQLCLGDSLHRIKQDWSDWLSSANSFFYVLENRSCSGRCDSNGLPLGGSDQLSAGSGLGCTWSSWLLIVNVTWQQRSRSTHLPGLAV